MEDGTNFVASEYLNFKDKSRNLRSMRFKYDFKKYLAHLLTLAFRIRLNSESFSQMIHAIGIQKVS